MSIILDIPVISAENNIETTENKEESMENKMESSGKNEALYSDQVMQSFQLYSYPNLITNSYYISPM